VVFGHFPTNRKIKGTADILAAFETAFGGARPKRLVEIMNVPQDRGLPLTTEDPDGFVVFYGGMIAKDRGLKDLVAACEDVGAKLIVAGHGPDEAELLGGIESSHAAVSLGTISYQEVLDQTAACQAVAALYDPSSPNNKFAAPNKLFEAMMFAKPVLGSEGTWQPTSSARWDARLSCAMETERT
jgi:glycosyltransferase involved in cell wall biosynthesis